MFKNFDIASINLTKYLFLAGKEDYTYKYHFNYKEISQINKKCFK